MPFLPHGRTFLAEPRKANGRARTPHSGTFERGIGNRLSGKVGRKPCGQGDALGVSENPGERNPMRTKPSSGKHGIETPSA